ncbi:hypothetical protein BaRGS_00007536 [Batillaria attramentaria]|uniref:Uncharacterized protein n=1 Tax=Batillaria attramentaria TaxID=370345 RepID=A0ABD0LP78_9CAEN
MLSTVLDHIIAFGSNISLPTMTVIGAVCRHKVALIREDLSSKDSNCSAAAITKTQFTSVTSGKHNETVCACARLVSVGPGPCCHTSPPPPPVCPTSSDAWLEIPGQLILDSKCEPSAYLTLPPQAKLQRPSDRDRLSVVVKYYSTAVHTQNPVLYQVCCLVSPQGQVSERQRVYRVSQLQERNFGNNNSDTSHKYMYTNPRDIHTTPFLFTRAVPPQQQDLFVSGDGQQSGESKRNCRDTRNEPPLMKGTLVCVGDGRRSARVTEVCRQTGAKPVLSKAANCKISRRALSKASKNAYWSC